MPEVPESDRRPRGLQAEFEVVDDDPKPVKKLLAKPAKIKAAVEDDEDDRPRKRRRDDDDEDDDDDDRPQEETGARRGDEEGGVSMTRNIVAAVVLILLIAVAAYVFTTGVRNRRKRISRRVRAIASDTVGRAATIRAGISLCCCRKKAAGEDRASEWCKPSGVPDPELVKALRQRVEIEGYQFLLPEDLVRSPEDGPEGESYAWGSQTLRTTRQASSSFSSSTIQGCQGRRANIGQALDKMWSALPGEQSFRSTTATLLKMAGSMDWCLPASS